VLVLLLALLVGVAPARLIAAAAETVAVERDVDRSPLGEAMVKFAEAGDIDGLEKLLDAGVDVDTVAPGDGTALIGAARGGQKATVEFLLDRNADPNVTSRGDGSPLIAAARNGHAKIVAALLAAGANLDEVVPGDENPLMQAAAHGQEEVVGLLLARGADVNAQSYEDGVLRTPLRLATRNGHAKIVKMLVEAGAKE
jgi:ankyrin repeat protein